MQFDTKIAIVSLTPDSSRAESEQFDSNEVLVHSAPPGTADRLALAFPREAQVDRLAGELQ